MSVQGVGFGSVLAGLQMTADGEGLTLSGGSALSVDVRVG